MKRIGILLILAVFTLGSCLMVIPGVKEGPKGPPTSKSRAVGPFSNNSGVRLEPGKYLGDFDIRANKVSIIGSGARNTVITGDITIYGNSCILRSLTIIGDVDIRGNNNDLTAAVVQGTVVSSGNNNAW